MKMKRLGEIMVSVVKVVPNRIEVLKSLLFLIWANAPCYWNPLSVWLKMKGEILPGDMKFDSKKKKVDDRELRNFVMEWILEK